MKIKNNFFSKLLMLILSSCASTGVLQNEIQSPVDKIHIGDSEKNVESILGQSVLASEDYTSKSFLLLQYETNNRPNLDITIDRNTKNVVGKGQWLYKGDEFYDLNTLIKKRFRGVIWKTFIPCHTWNDKDAILVNQDRGFYIAVEHGSAGFVSWSTPELVKLRVDLLYKNCPRLQPKGP